MKLGGNDLDSPEDVEIIVLRLICFLTQLRSGFHLSNIVVLSFAKRNRTRNILTHLYNARVQQANVLKLHTTIVHIRFWKLTALSCLANNISVMGYISMPTDRFF